jgi:alkylation response protein AidB-like acyl-CoA dehydrogenase
MWMDWYVHERSQMWISNAKEAGVFVVFATIDPALGYKGITAFVIDKVRISFVFLF